VGLDIDWLGISINLIMLPHHAVLFLGSILLLDKQIIFHLFFACSCHQVFQVFRVREGELAGHRAFERMLSVEDFLVSDY